MTDSKIRDFAKTATNVNERVALDGLNAVVAAAHQLSAHIRQGLPAKSRIPLFQRLQNGLGLAMQADGRQSLVEDLLANEKQLEPAVDVELGQAIHQLLLDFGVDAPARKRYSEEDLEDTEDFGEGSDDPPACEEQTRRPWYKAPETKAPASAAQIIDLAGKNQLTPIVNLPPEPTPAQRRDLEQFFRSL
jgi:hypothetical protein